SNLDGHASQTFHRKCDNKGATIVVGRIANSSRLVGGYNPLDWNGHNVWKKTKNSFLFVLDKNDLKKATVSRVNHNLCNRAIGCSGDHGPLFGGHDLLISNNMTIWEFKTKTYPRLINTNSLSVSDYEVLQ
ncbi:36297_t:CDS:1, partial [Racocetra persica]